MRRLSICSCLAIAVLWATRARADLVEYLVGGNRELTLNIQGKATVHPGKTMTVTTKKFGSLHFGLDDVKIHKVPTLEQQFGKQLTQAKSDPGAVLQAAQWSLRHGMLSEFYAAVDKVLELDPKHAEAKRIKALKAQMEKDLGDSSKQQDELKKFVNRPQMKIDTSKHFVLMYDTPDKAEKGRKPHHKQRIELLEKVYESFMLTFFSRGVPLELPKEKLKVVLFNQHQDYLDFSVRLDPFLINAAGFYMHEPNTSFFFVQGTNKIYDEIAKMLKPIHEAAEEAKKKKGGKDIIRLSKTLDVLLNIAKEGQDIEVVSHECTHQLAANTGLFPRNVRIPRWVHEGLAAYFESPSDGAWSGVGAVNEQRIMFYRALESDREHSNIDFIVGDQIFDYAGSIGAFLHGYGQAWALTHFLIEKHLDEFIRYYRELGEMPPDVRLNPQLLNTLFEKVFTNKAALDIEWRGYMRGLKTDIQVILDK
ncbi:MAG TPA: DUF1570 domain-containing protein [Pirellulales bacterium]|nr:DUF1570 domain-containing protein [Pirellulales bacterium]